jgi:hypothetical protein
VERRGFELPVLFVLPYIQVSLVSQEISTQWFAKNRSEKVVSDTIHRRGHTENERISNTLPGVKNLKRDRQFESPSLQQRVSANRRFRSIFLKVGNSEGGGDRLEQRFVAASL